MKETAAPEGVEIVNLLLLGQGSERYYVGITRLHRLLCHNAIKGVRSRLRGHI